MSRELPSNSKLNLAIRALTEVDKLDAVEADACEDVILYLLSMKEARTSRRIQQGTAATRELHRSQRWKPAPLPRRGLRRTVK